MSNFRKFDPDKRDLAVSSPQTVSTSMSKSQTLLADRSVKNRKRNFLLDTIHNRTVFRYTSLPDGSQLVTLNPLMMDAASQAIRDDEENAAKAIPDR